MAIVSLCIGLSTINAQDNDCHKTKVAVSVDVVDDAYNLLTTDFGQHAPTEWNGFTTQMLVQILSQYEPEITFVALSESSGDHHYTFGANMTITVVEEDGEKQTGYWITASLVANANCVPNRARKVASSALRGRDRELKQAMKNLASYFQPMDMNIIRHEKDHPSAPRKPELTMEFEKDYISPLDKDSRKTKINGKVYNCQGELVCDKKGRGQPIYYEDKIDRLDLKKGRCEGGYHKGKFMVIITYKDCNNNGEYALKEGLEAEKKTIRFQTCQLGGPIVEVEKELIIRGLEVKVRPKRREIEAGQHTDIVLSLKETEPDGNQYPVEGKELEVKINGLENGTVKPKNGYTTNSDGEVVLDYKAGSEDEKITITAIFQPEDYPDKATARNFVEVKPIDYEAKITITKTYEKTLSIKDEDTKKENIYTRNVHESIDATIDIYVKLTEVQDMPIFNQTWQYYTPISANIVGFNYSFKEHQHRQGPKYDTNVNINGNASSQEISEKASATQVPWVVAIDNKTKNVLKIVPAGYTIDFDIDEISQLKSIQQTDKGTEIESETTNKTKEQSFGIGPVGEEITDPTVKMSDTWIQDYLKDQGIDLPPGVPIPKIPNQETAKDIKPDVLVSTRDKKYSFGGFGERTIPKELPNGKQEEKLTYKWNMTLVKK